MNTKRFLYLQSFTSSSVRVFTFKFYKGLSLHGFLKQFYPKTFSSDIQEREEQKKKSNRPYMKHAESPAKTNITKKPLRSLDWPQHGGTLVNVLELPTKKKARSINTPKNAAVNSITFL